MTSNPASNFLTNSVLTHGYDKPWAVTYFNTSSFLLYLVPFALLFSSNKHKEQQRRQRRRIRSASSNSRSSIPFAEQGDHHAEAPESPRWWEKLGFKLPEEIDLSQQQQRPGAAGYQRLDTEAAPAGERRRRPAAAGAGARQLSFTGSLGGGYEQDGEEEEEEEEEEDADAPLTNAGRGRPGAGAGAGAGAGSVAGAGEAPSAAALTAAVQQSFAPRPSSIDGRRPASFLRVSRPNSFTSPSTNSARNLRGSQAAAAAAAASASASASASAAGIAGATAGSHPFLASDAEGEESDGTAAAAPARGQHQDQRPFYTRSRSSKQSRNGGSRVRNLSAHSHYTHQSNSTSSLLLAAPQHDLGVSSAHSHSNSVLSLALPPLTLRETASLSLQFTLVWFLANYTLNAGLGLTSVASGTTLSAASGFFTLALGSLARVETFTYAKLAAVVVSFAGVGLVTLADASGRSAGGSGGGAVSTDLAAMLAGARGEEMPLLAPIMRRDAGGFLGTASEPLNAFGGDLLALSSAFCESAVVGLSFLHSASAALTSHALRPPTPFPPHLAAALEKSTRCT